MNRLTRPTMMVLLAAVFILAVGCASYDIQRQTRRKYPRIRKAEDIRCFRDAAPIGPDCKLLAVVSSDASSTSTLETRATQMEALKKAAARVGAEAVYGVRVETRQTRGLVEDPQTPFPSIAQGWTDSYYLRGEAVLFRGNWPADEPQYSPKPTGRRNPDEEEPSVAGSVLPRS